MFPAVNLKQLIEEGFRIKCALRYESKMLQFEDGFKIDPCLYVSLIPFLVNSKL